MADWDVGAFEDGLIADMRAHDGQVTQGPLKGHPLMILWSTGARTGERRRSILTWSRDGDDYIVTGTASGSPRVPGWVHNIESDPKVTIEVANRTFAATARVDDENQARLWAQHVAALPWFADYPAQSGRVIPVIRVTPTGDAEERSSS
jgi:deazaflavin-dependent oxidoreductase (nitroreductase family)